MSGHYRKEKNCLNCGHHVEEHYCTRCGQPNVELKEPFWGFMAHSIGHYFHFDSKFFHTLWPLLTQPGQVTLDYIAGKRARYIHPVSLYIFVSIVYFLIVPHALEEKKQERTERQINQDVRKKLGVKPGSKEDLTEDIDSNLKVLPKSVKAGIKNMLTQAEFGNLTVAHEEHYLDSLKRLNAVKPSESLEEEISDLNKILIDKKDSTASAYLQRQESLPKAERDGWFKTQMRKKKISATKGDAAKGGWNIQEELEKYKPKQYFLLMPLLALFIMINFRRNHIYYIDHLVFTIHGMTAYFILSIVAQPMKKYIFGLDSISSDFIGMAVFVAVVWYLYKALKLFYNRSKGVTIRKMISLMFLYWMALYISEEAISFAITYVLH